MTLDEIKAAIDEGRATKDMDHPCIDGSAQYVSLRISPPETPGQRIASLYKYVIPLSWEQLARSIDAAVAAERKACEEIARSAYPREQEGFCVAGSIAARIAARGRK